MQEQDRIIDALKTIMKLSAFFSANVEKLENRLSEALPKMDWAVSSLLGKRESHSARKRERRFEQEEERKSAGRLPDRMERECARQPDASSANDRVLISATAFWCMVEVIISLAAAFVCTCAANARLIHSIFASGSTRLYPLLSRCLCHVDQFYMPQVKTRMKHYQLNKYKYDNSKGEIPPVNSRRCVRALSFIL